VRRPDRSPRKSLARRDEGLGQDLAAVDHPPALAAAAVSREAGRRAAERFHVEDREHPLER
jgi:hypothetical protein